MKSCIIYARVSSRQQRRSENSIAGQVKGLKRYARQNDYKVNRVLMEHASGSNLDRPALKEALQETKRGGIKYLLIRDLTRLARNLIYQAQILRLFKGNGVKVITLDNQVH